MFVIIACLFMIFPFLFVGIYYLVGVINLIKTRKTSAENRLNKKILKLQKEIQKLGGKK